VRYYWYHILGALLLPDEEIHMITMWIHTMGGANPIKQCRPNFLQSNVSLAGTSQHARLAPEMDPMTVKSY
jgi:hypothetical protein